MNISDNVCLANAGELNNSLKDGFDSGISLFFSDLAFSVSTKSFSETVRCTHSTIKSGSKPKRNKAFHPKRGKIRLARKAALMFPTIPATAFKEDIRPIL